jgi:hypothetical protein
MGQAQSSRAATALSAGLVAFDEDAEGKRTTGGDDEELCYTQSLAADLATGMAISQASHEQKMRSEVRLVDAGLAQVRPLPDTPS